MIAAALCVAAGFWFLLFTERVQRGVIWFHDRVRDLDGPVFLIRLTARNLEASLRLLGAGLLVAGLVLAITLVLAWEQGERSVPSGAASWRMQAV